MNMENEKRRQKLTNRHIAKLLSRLQPLSMPAICISEIKKEMWWLSDDLKELYEGKGGKYGERHKSKIE